MDSQDKSLRRYILFLPINNNTQNSILRILDYVTIVAGGCTYSRFHNPPRILDRNKKISGYFTGRYVGEHQTYPEEDVVYLMTDIDIIKNPNLHANLKKLISMIEGIGEEEAWLTYHDITLAQSH